MRKQILNWEGNQKRWAKMVDGKRLVLTHRQAKQAGYQGQWTKEHSLAFANDWFGVQGQAKLTPAHPHQEAIATLKTRAAIAKQLGLATEAKKLQERAKDVAESYPVDLPYIEQEALVKLYQLQLQLGATFQNFDATKVNMLLGSGAITADRKKRIKAAPEEKALKTNLDNWLAFAKARTTKPKLEKGSLSFSSYNEFKYSHQEILDFFGEAFDCSQFNERHFEQFWLHLSGLKCGTGLKRKKWLKFKGFLKTIYKNHILDRLPTTFDDSLLGFDDYKHEPKNKILTAQQAKQIIDTAKGQLKAHLLLMLNCGYTQADISELTLEELDLEAATITRKRTKTVKRKYTPVVCYPLWKATVEAIKAVKRVKPINPADENKVFLTLSGKPWVRKGINKNEKFTQTDSIAALKRNFPDVGFHWKLSGFRTTSSTLIGNSEHKASIDLFLGHSPEKLSQLAYSLPDFEAVKKAVLWLAKQYGLN